MGTVESTTELYGGTVKLTLDKKHRYSASINGGASIILPGCTGITSILDKPALIPWAKKMVLEDISAKIWWEGHAPMALVDGQPVPLCDVSFAAVLRDAKYADRRSRDRAATIGDATHRWVEAHIRAVMGEGEDPKPPKNKAVKNGTTAFLQWEKANAVGYVFTERPCCSVENLYAGTVDIVATIGASLVVVDLKTSSGVYPEMHLQVAGYQSALEEEFAEKFDRRIILHLPREGGMSVHDIDEEGKGYEADRSAFLACREVVRWKKGV